MYIMHIECGWQLCLVELELLVTQRFFYMGHNYYSGSCSKFPGFAMSLSSLFSTHLVCPRYGARENTHTRLAGKKAFLPSPFARKFFFDRIVNCWTRCANIPTSAVSFTCRPHFHSAPSWHKNRLESMRSVYEFMIQTFNPKLKPSF